MWPYCNPRGDGMRGAGAASQHLAAGRAPRCQAPQQAARRVAAPRGWAGVPYNVPQQRRPLVVVFAAVPLLQELVKEVRVGLGYWVGLIDGDSHASSLWETFDIVYF